MASLSYSCPAHHLPLARPAISSNRAVTTIITASVISRIRAICIRPIYGSLRSVGRASLCQPV